ncbi:StAR-related lipid transfer protein 7, mitochondrial-like protein [Drosera capensis]
MALIEALWVEFGFLVDVILYLVPIWAAFLTGLMIGWAWRPSWAKLDWIKLDDLVSKVVSAPSSLMEPFASSSSFREDIKGNANDVFSSELKAGDPSSSSSKVEGEDQPAVVADDFRHLFRLVEEADGGPSWIQMMDRSTPTMSYHAWRRDPKTGPPQYRSSTIYEDATPEMVRDFFWDNEFRAKWDDMLLQSKTVESCSTTGTMIVQWIRKFPFFCSDREYIIGRRIWESGRVYYCVTKGVPCPSIPRHDKPRRVDLYYSSWCIRAVESRRGTGEMTACEVLLFHHEDMGIPWELAKLGVRQGMWGTVKKIEPGLRAYQKARLSGEPLSHSASMAHITTRASPQYLRSLLTDNADVSETQVAPVPEKQRGFTIPKILVFGGAIALACTLDQGLITKAVIFGVARRIGRLGDKV